MSKILLNIDGQQVEATRGETVLQAAHRAGIKIPALCYHPELKPYGSCRLCVVEIEGMRGYPTSCTTPVEEGMKVKTATDPIMGLRREILKLLMSGHTSPCLVCLHRVDCEKYRPSPTKAGKTTRCTFCSSREECELRKLVLEYGINELDIPIIYKNLELERTDPFMDRDYNLCILCGRCVRICEQLHGKTSISFINRGDEARIGTAFTREHTASGCSFCGACIDICPVGALTDRYAKWYGAPARKENSVCTLCPVGCEVNLLVKNDQVIGAGPLSLTKEQRLCTIGRFVLPQLYENPLRVTKHQIRIKDGLRQAKYEEALTVAAGKLANYKGTSFALIAHAAMPREERALLEHFTREVMGSSHFAAENSPEFISLKQKLQQGTIKALLTTGDFLPAALAGQLELLIVIDPFPSSISAKADVLFAPAVFAEGKLAGTDVSHTDISMADGSMADSQTFLAAGNTQRPYTAAVPARGNLLFDWQIVNDLADRLGKPGCGLNRELKTVAAIREIIHKLNYKEVIPDIPEPSPLDDIKALPATYRGHKLSELVCALQSLNRKTGECVKDSIKNAAPDAFTAPAKTSTNGTGFLITYKQEVVPNTHIVTVHAPTIAGKCLPGQFVIAMVHENSERIPYTVADWDKEKGTVTLNILETGRSSRELALLKQGDYLKHFAGPLGSPIEVKKYGTVVLGGGCFGVGGILPLARALKAAGNRVICIEEASSAYLLYWQKELQANSDEFMIATKDGSVGVHGGVQEVITRLVNRGEKIDQAFIIGCTFMMMKVSETTKQHGIPTQTALNPIMLDGTGMCGACRVTVDGTMKFACVDGPFLDGHKIDWVELLQRRSAYKQEEIIALPQEPVQAVHKNGDDDHYHEHKCLSI